MKKTMKKSYFTLLELLIVVAILAIIAGGIVAAYTNVEENAAQAQAARDIAAVDQAIQIMSAFDSKIPDNVDSLLSAAVASVAITGDAATNSTGSSVVNASAMSNLRVAAAIDNRDERAFNPDLATDDSLTTSATGGGLAGKVSAQALTQLQIDNLDAAGLTTIRYIDQAIDVNGGTGTSVINVFGTATTTSGYGDINNISIPQNYFEAPRGASNNRGRGFEMPLSSVAPTTDGTDGDEVFAVWGGQDAFNPTPNYNTSKLGAKPDAVLVAFGLGPNNTLVGKDAKFGLTSGMPYYANVKKNEYNNYIMLVDVTQRPAKVVAVIDTKGDFRAEEYAEYLDQKL